MDGARWWRSSTVARSVRTVARCCWEVERQTRVLERVARCFVDHRDAERIEHPVRTLVSQRILALALGYEDLNDHDELRADPLLASVVGAVDAG